MEKQYVKIKCPNDGAVLKVAIVEDLEKRSIKCPICGCKTPYAQYLQVVEENAGAATEYPTDDARGNKINIPGDTTQINNNVNLTAGRLVMKSTGEGFQLKIGKNIVGRRAANSSATIQIPCTTNRMSREHLVIEVKNEDGLGVFHYAYLNKAKVNATYIGSSKLEVGDCHILKDGDIIKLPDVDVVFVLPDSFETKLDD